MKILVIGSEKRVTKYTKDVTVFDKHSIAYVPTGAPDEDVLAAGKDADVILVDAMGKVTANVIEQMPNLKMIHSEGVGYNGVAVDLATEKNIFVCNCKGMNAKAVAEQALLLMLGVLRSVHTGDKDVRAGRQIQTKERVMAAGSLMELSDCTIGLVGFGDIAQETARFLNAFDAKVVYSKPRRASKELEEKFNVEYMELDEMLATCDMISLHTPVTPATENMADEAFFAKMKKGSYLINTSRGELVDSKALLAAIESGHLAGAGLDTIANEPVCIDNEILKAEDSVEEKILYSCHIGGVTASSFARGYAIVWDNIQRLCNGERPINIVNNI